MHARPEKIEFAILPCSLGLVLTSTSERGLLAVLIGSGEAELTSDLQSRFPKALLARGGYETGRLALQVAALAEDPAQPLSTPLDLRGTEFQRRVWTRLRSIPAGRTATYSEIAAALGVPGSARAVAGACAANRLALVVPCHRVVRSDGSLAGYRWGVERKEALLSLESSPSASAHTPG